MEQQVPTLNLLSPIPSHYSVVSDSSPTAVQDPRTLDVLPNQQQVMSPNSTPTATLMQATCLDIPVQMLEQFAQASVLDASILEDLRSAVVELHDRMQYRTIMFLELHNLIAENQGLRSELVEARTHLADAREDLQHRVSSLEGAKLGTVQWQAQVESEAHIAKIEANLTEMHDRQRRNDERSETVYQACTSAVGKVDPATCTAL